MPLLNSTHPFNAYSFDASSTVNFRSTMTETRLCSQDLTRGVVGELEKERKFIFLFVNVRLRHRDNAEYVTRPIKFHGAAFAIAALRESWMTLCT